MRGVTQIVNSKWIVKLRFLRGIREPFLSLLQCDRLAIKRRELVEMMKVFSFVILLFFRISESESRQFLKREIEEHAKEVRKTLCNAKSCKKCLRMGFYSNRKKDETRISVNSKFICYNESLWRPLIGEVGTKFLTLKFFTLNQTLNMILTLNLTLHLALNLTSNLT